MFQGTKEMSKIAYAGGMLVAAIVDTIGLLIPVIGTVFISLMSFSFWLIGYDMRNAGKMTLINGLLEMLPVIPCCMYFMWRSHKQNKLNIKERKKSGDKNGLVSGEMLA